MYSSQLNIIVFFQQGPNDWMFLNTPEVSQNGFFYALETCLFHFELL